MDVTVEKITKEYNGLKVLDIERLTISKGKIYAILGLNGCGKSTLLECIAGLMNLDSGRIIYNNFEYEAVKKDISMMGQKPYLFNKTVLENIRSGLEFRKYDKNIIGQRLEKYLKYFDMKELLHKNAKKLSGGEAAKTALLRTAVLESELTLLDEPTASMDMESTLKAEKLIKEMVDKDRTVILITHDLYQAQRIADEVLFMDKGNIIEQGKKTTVFAKPNSKLVKMMLNI